MPARPAAAAQPFSGQWFGPLYQRMTAVGVYLMLIFLLLACLQGFWQRDGALALRAGLIYVPLAVLATALTAGATLELMTITDGISGFVIGDLGSNLGDLVARLAAAFLAAAGLATAADVASGGTASFGVVALAVLILGAAVTLALELMARLVVIYLAVLFLPIAFAAMVWPRAAHLARRLIELLAGAILLKLVVVVVVTMAAAMFAAASPLTGGLQGEAGLADILTGLVVLVLGALSPLALARLIPIVETGAVGLLASSVRTIPSRVSRPAGLTTRSATRSVLGAIGRGAPDRGAGPGVMVLPPGSRVHVWSPSGDDPPPAAAGGPAPPPPPPPSPPPPTSAGNLGGRPASAPSPSTSRAAGTASASSRSSVLSEPQAASSPTGGEGPRRSPNGPIPAARRGDAGHAGGQDTHSGRGR